jgi:hypothetical protein
LNSFALSKLSEEKAIFLLEKDFGHEFASTFVSLVTSIQNKLFARKETKERKKFFLFFPLFSFCKVWKVCHDSARYNQ